VELKQSASDDARSEENFTEAALGTPEAEPVARSAP
jgi:hypothetical protein